MNEQALKHCSICHSAIKSNTIEYDSKKPIIRYLEPLRCPICNNEDYLSREKKIEPTEEKGVMCQCLFADCNAVFFSRLSWYEQQKASRFAGNIWMPICIDNNFEKLNSMEKFRIGEK